MLQPAAVCERNPLFTLLASSPARRGAAGALPAVARAFGNWVGPQSRTQGSFLLPNGQSFARSRPLYQSARSNGTSPLKLLACLRRLNRRRLISLC